MRGWQRALIALVGCGLSSLLVVPSCSSDGDVLVELPEDDALGARDATSGKDSTLIDADRDAGETFGDSAFEVLDVSELRCNVEAGLCRLPAEQCCVHLISMFCAPSGTCDGGAIECSRQAHCDAGLRCCGQGAAFSIVSSCAADCPVYTLCASNDECPDGGRCVDGGAGGFAICE